MDTALDHSPSVTAYLALGSNLGDRMTIVQSALNSLRCARGIEVQAVSTIIETAPVSCGDQDAGGPYLNAAVKIRTSLTPRELLDTCLAIEKNHGRDRMCEARWGPRTLDIDLLLYGDQYIDDPGPPPLRVPHPGMTARPFVLVPLAEIAPDAVHPIAGKTAATLLDELLKASET